MCGIFTVISNEKSFKAQEDIVGLFKQGVAITALRGTDSTGVAVIRENGELKVHKKAMASQDFLELTTTKAVLEVNYPNKAEVMIGHCRAKTVGNTTNENSHPFQRGHVTLVHNGTLTNHALLTNTPYAVDSDAIACALSESEDGYVSVLEKLQGAYALVWHDANDNSIYLARNDERPLSMGITESGSMIVASELDMIIFLASRNVVKLVSTHRLPPSLLTKIDLSTMSVETTKFTPREKIQYYQHGAGAAFYQRSAAPVEVNKNVTVIDNTKRSKRRQTNSVSESNFVVGEIKVINEGGAEGSYAILYDEDNAGYIINPPQKTFDLLNVGSIVYVSVTSNSTRFIRGKSYGVAYYVRPALTDEREDYLFTSSVDYYTPAIC